MKKSLDEAELSAVSFHPMANDVRFFYELRTPWRVLLGTVEGEDATLRVQIQVDYQHWVSQGDATRLLYAMKPDLDRCLLGFQTTFADAVRRSDLNALHVVMDTVTGELYKVWAGLVLAGKFASSMGKWRWVDQESYAGPTPDEVAQAQRVLHPHEEADHNAPTEPPPSGTSKKPPKPDFNLN